jgi:hypothetical protein
VAGPDAQPAIDERAAALVRRAAEQVRAPEALRERIDAQHAARAPRTRARAVLGALLALAVRVRRRRAA